MREKVNVLEVILHAISDDALEEFTKAGSEGYWSEVFDLKFFARLRYHYDLRVLPFRRKRATLPMIIEKRRDFLYGAVVEVPDKGVRDSVCPSSCVAIAAANGCVNFVHRYWSVESVIGTSTIRSLRCGWVEIAKAFSPDLIQQLIVSTLKGVYEAHD